MIFVTVGTQLGFDRLVSVVDRWAAAHPDKKVLAQVGPSKTIYTNLLQRSFLSPVEYAKAFADSELVVSHAGMGTIITALSSGKPIIVMPRRYDLGEHRNDHQIATVQRLRSYSCLSVADDEGSLLGFLDHPPGSDRSCISESAGKSLIAKIESFLLK